MKNLIDWFLEKTGTLYVMVMGALILIALFFKSGKYFKNMFVILFAVAIFSGCKTTDITSSTKTNIVYRDTIITLAPIKAELPKSVVEITGEIKIKNGLINIPEQKRTDGLIEVVFSVKNNIPYIRASLTDSFIYITPKPVALKNAIQTKTVIETIVIKERYIPKKYKNAMWFQWIIILIGTGIIGYKFSLHKLIGRGFSFITKLF